MTQHLQQGGLSEMAGMGGASAAEMVKLQGLQMKYHASAGLRKTGQGMREVLMQGKIVQLKKEHALLKEQIDIYPEPFKAKAELQLNALWGIDMRMCELSCDLSEVGENEVYLRSNLQSMLTAQVMEKGRCEEYLLRLGQAVEYYAKSEYMGLEFLKEYEKRLKGDSAKDVEGESIRKEAEKMATQKRKLEAAEWQAKHAKEMANGGSMVSMMQALPMGQSAIMNHYQQQLAGPGQGGFGKKPRPLAAHEVNARGGLGAGGMVQPMYRKGGMLGERRGIEWVDAEVWHPELKGALAPKPGTFTNDRRYNYDCVQFPKGQVNPRNDGRMTCDICGKQGHAAAECGRDYTGQPSEFQRAGKRHLTWVFLDEKKLCNAFGRKLGGGTA